MFLFCYRNVCLLLIQINVLYVSCTARSFHIGIIWPWEGFYAAGSHSVGGIHIALDAIRQDNVTFYEIHRAGYELKYSLTETGCSPSVAIPSVADYMDMVMRKMK